MATLNFPDDPTTGDVYKDGNSGFSYEWNGTVWISTDPSTASNIREIDDISSGFDGSDTTFTLQVAGVNVEPANAQQLIISVGGVMQNAGQDFTVSGAVLTFTTAPSSGLTFFGVLLGTALSLNTVADASVGSAALKTEDFTIGGSGNTVTIPGNLTVQGTETIINTNELNVQDKTIGIGSTNAPTAASQDGAGAIIYGQTHINILYDVDKAALGISTAVNVAGVVTATEVNATTRLVATAATVGSGVTINNTGIDAGNAGIMTAGTVSAPSNLVLSLDTTEKARLDSSGRLLVGATGDDNGTGALMQVAATAGTAAFSANRYTNTADGPSRLYLFKSRATSIGGQTIVQDGDDLGEVVFQGSDGTDATQAALIRAEVDGTPGDNDMPGSLSIHTTKDGNAAPTEAVKVDSSQRVNIGGAAVSQTRTVNIGSNAEANLAIETHNDSTSETANVRFYKSGNTGASPQVVETDDNIAQLVAYGYDGTDYACSAASLKMSVDGAPGSNDMPGKIIVSTTADGATSPTERLKITSTGGFQFSNGLFDEKCNITAGKLSDNQDIDLADGMVHYFSTQESTTATPNIRINSSISLQTAMDTGDVCSVTLITTAAAGGYSANLTIDGNAVTEEWVGGSAPDSGSDDGLDIYTYTIICIGTGTGDSGFKVIANLTNATN
jgi:hypothetical protein